MPRSHQSSGGCCLLAPGSGSHSMWSRAGGSTSGPGLRPSAEQQAGSRSGQTFMTVPDPNPGEMRLQLTLRTGRPPHCAPPGLLDVRADGMVSPGSMQHPPCPLLRAPPETTELLLLGAWPPKGPLTHFTLHWQEGREGEEKGEEEGSHLLSWPRIP